MTHIHTRNDEGITLTEMTVGMLVMSIISAMTVVAIINLSDLTVTSTDLSDNAFDARYATQVLSRDALNIEQIYRPGVHGDHWYVEYCVPPAIPVEAANPDLEGLPGHCVQWRLTPEDKRLEMREVSVNHSGCNIGGMVPQWQTLATGLENTMADPPLLWLHHGLRDEKYQAVTDFRVARSNASTSSNTLLVLPSAEPILHDDITAKCPSLERI